MTAVSTQSTEASYSEGVNCLKMHMDENAKGENQIIKSELKFPTRQKKRLIKSDIDTFDEQFLEKRFPISV